MKNLSLVSENMKIRIKACSNPILWYNDQIGSEYTVSFETNDAYWLVTSDESAPLKWVYIKDCEEA